MNDLLIVIKVGLAKIFLSLRNNAIANESHTNEGTNRNEHLILNHLLLIFKMYVYTARTTGYLNKSHLLIYIKGIKYTKEKLCENNAKRREKKLTRNGKMFQ